jgi:short subunit dehydrogenase-like uncharacterized protein
MTVLIYGAYGYTGELISREAADRGLDFVVAGRNGTKTRGLGIELDVESRVCGAEDLGEHLDDIDVVLNCAGPFVKTYEPVVEACLEHSVHYLDITGELPVFESLAERDRDAENADICLLPGTGFDVVPTDCLAGHLHDRLQSATQLTLAFDAGAKISGGTLASVIEHASDGGRIRKDGRLEQTPIAHESRQIDFGDGPRNATTIPWGDVSTAYYTTGIPNIEVYMAMPKQMEYLMQSTNYTSDLLSIGPVKSALQSAAQTFVHGPSERTRETEEVRLWGEASDGETTVTSRLRTPETYQFTVDAATTILEKLEAGADPTGYHTPSSAFDPSFVLELDGVEGFIDD